MRTNQFDSKLDLLPKGFLQQYGIDFTETFAPVAKIKSIKIVLSLTASLDLELKQIDFDTAFLNAKLNEEVYMELPDGLQGYPAGTVCKLQRALYGLKQAPHEWNQELHEYLISINYRQLECDKCIYLKYTQENRMILLCLYVDDTVIAYHLQDEPVWLSDKQSIAGKYAIKDLGDCEWILNMKVTRNRDTRTLTLSQEAYVKRVAETYDLQECKSATNPLVDTDLYTPPSDADTTPLEPKGVTEYQSMIGSILYAALTTRPDIAFAVSELSRFNSCPTRLHYKAARHTIRYLATTSNWGLQFKADCDPTLLKPEIWVDASWGSNTATRHSTTGLVVKFNGSVICWSTKKQKTVALSSTESEYMAMTEAATEALWLRTWLAEVFNKKTPVVIYCDNQSAIALTKNDTFHQRTKHIDIRYHFIRQHVRDCRIIVKWVETTKQQADILTKRLATTQFNILRDQLMVTV